MRISLIRNLLLIWSTNLFKAFICASVLMCSSLIFLTHQTEKPICYFEFTTNKMLNCAKTNLKCQKHKLDIWFKGVLPGLEPRIVKFESEIKMLWLLCFPNRGIVGPESGTQPLGKLRKHSFIASYGEATYVTLPPILRLWRPDQFYQKQIRNNNKL